MNLREERIKQLLAELESPPTVIDPLTKDQEVMRLRAEMAEAKKGQRDAQSERDQAVKELADTKEAIQWTMDKLKIKDLFGLRGSIQVPCAADGYLELLNVDPEDTKRIEWINRHGRTGAGSEVFTIALPCVLDIERDTIPNIYNVRHIIDVCRKSRPNGDVGL